MANEPLDTVIRQIREVVAPADEDTDAQLLARFIDERDEAAFAIIVRRHAAMIMSVCRRVTRDAQDADDAFQATFLVLVRKAAAVARRELLANWLYGVAHNTALKARAQTMRRRAREKRLAELPEPMAREARDDALAECLDVELSRLPDKYRAPIVLCDLEGKSRKEAAALLGCPDGSLSSRLARGRTLLVKRLTRRGVAVSSAAITAVFEQMAAAAECAPTIVQATVHHALSIQSGVACAEVPPRVLALAEGMVKAMFMKKVRLAALVITCGLIAALGLMYAQAGAGQGGERPKQPPMAAGKNAEKNTTKADVEALQGKWHVVTAERFGMTWKNVDGEFVNQTKGPMAFPISVEAPDTVAFAGDECTVEFRQGPGRTLVVKDTFTLDTARTPNWITLTADDGRLFLGIYALEGATVRMAWQYGRRRTQRPADFTTKKDIDGDDDVEVWVLKRQSENRADKAKPKAKLKGVPIQRAWDGILQDRTLITQSPPDGFVADAETWEKMWKAWRPGDKLPALDFAKELVIFQTVPGPNKIDPPVLALDAAGNLKVPLPISTLLPDDRSIGYTILVIDRAGIRFVNGVAIDKRDSKDV